MQHTICNDPLKISGRQITKGVYKVQMRKDLFGTFEGTIKDFSKQKKIEIQKTSTSLWACDMSSLTKPFCGPDLGTHPSTKDALQG